MEHNYTREGRVIGVSIVPRGEMVKETYIVTGLDKVIAAREPYSHPVEPSRFDKLIEEPTRFINDKPAFIDEVEVVEAGKYIIVNGIRWHVGLKEWEKPLVATALYFAEYRPEEEVLRDMEGLVGGEMAERIASLSWRIAYGEGYTLDQWAGLLERLKIHSPWEYIWRFQELAGKGLRKKHTTEPADIEDWEALRSACKHLGTG